MPLNSFVNAALPKMTLVLHSSKGNEVLAARGRINTWDCIGDGMTQQSLQHNFDKLTGKVNDTLENTKGYSQVKKRKEKN